MELDQLFVEQAEYLESESFEQWHAEHPDEAMIVRKLTQGGAKLISGPRGCGKTTLMLKALHKMQQSIDAAFPVYVNYKRSLTLEPIYKNGGDGTYWFNQWVIIKIYLGIFDSLDKLSIRLSLSIDRAQAQKSAALLEMSNATNVKDVCLSVEILERDINRILEEAGRSRCVLLLDDAAHAFSPEQQRDFFDFFRQVKSPVISPKAAVYPGVTSYSSSFHVGHDAEQIDVWIKPDRDEYLQFMEGMVKVRFPELSMYDDVKNSESLRILCYASFGVPRALLNMLQYLQNEQEDGTISFLLSRIEVLKAIKQHYSNTKKLFTSLSGKLPVYKEFIITGESILSKSIETIKTYNKAKAVEKQSVSIAIEQNDLTQEYSLVFSLFQYAGLCIPKDELISRGQKGKFRIFMFHYAGLIDGNALFGSKSINFRDYITAFTKRNAHEFTRTRANALLGKILPEKAFLLSLPPCGVCGASRKFEDSKFCPNCGSALTASSTYLELVNSDIKCLPLTPKRVSKIKEQSSIRKVKDILMDTEHKQLLNVDMIGKYWAARIVALAEEFIE